MFLPRLASLLNRSSVLSTALTKPNTWLRSLLPSITGDVSTASTNGHQCGDGCHHHYPTAVQQSQTRAFHDYGVLKRRCDKCYFKKVDDRWWVLCNAYPKHRQRQQVKFPKQSWIVTHITRTGSYKKKHFQYPHQEL